MSVDIGETVSEGFNRTISRNGLVLVAIMYAIAIVNRVVTADLGPQSAAEGPVMASQVPSLGLPPLVAIGLALVLSLTSTVVTVGAIRTFVTDETETLQQDDFTRNILLVVVNLIVGGIALGIILLFGFLLLIIPGIFLAVSLFFWNYFVIVEDANFIEGFQKSWGATSGNRSNLFILGFIVIVIMIVIYLVFNIPAVVSPIAGLFIGQLGAAIANVFFLASASRAFVKLTGGGDADDPEAQPKAHAVE